MLLDATVDGRTLRVLVQGKEWPDRIGRLRNEDNIVEAGEDVMLIGYPGEEGARSVYSVVYSRVKTMNGVHGGDKWLQFEDAARQGNSGGPLLDRSGNVVGVVTGKAEYYVRNEIAARNDVVDTADLAIHLSVLKGFLKDHHVGFETNNSLMQLSKGQQEDRGSEFVVHVLCRQ